MMKSLQTHIIAVAIAAALVVAGCGKPQTETQPGASEPTAAATADAQLPPAPIESNPAPATDDTLLGGAGFTRKSRGNPFAKTGQTLKENYKAAPELATGSKATTDPDTPEIPVSVPGATVAGTNATRPGGAEFTRKSLASPFARADQALKEGYDSALIAFQIGNYARAVTELEMLAESPDLNSEQHQAVRKLLAQTLKAAPELSATNSAAAASANAKTETPLVFPLAPPDHTQSPGSLPENPFSTADPPTRESFARANAALNIGNYESAVLILKELVTNAQLNWQQKYAAQSLLDKTPQSAPATPSPRR
jgi:hypothetical protein